METPMIDATEQHDKGRFRVTAWPDRLFLPPVRRADAYSLDDSGSVLVRHAGWGSDDAECETYLSLYAVDLDSPDAILDFANSHAHLEGIEMWNQLTDQSLIPRCEPDLEIFDAQRQSFAWDSSRYGSPLEGEPLEGFRYAAR